MPKFVTASVIAVYLYAITILTRYGFDSYFSLPSDFIASSLKENIIFFFQLSQLALSVLAVITLGAWVVLTVVALILFFVYAKFIHHTFLAALVVLAVGISILFGFYHFGNFLAANSTNFYALPNDCPAVGPEKMYIVADINDGKAIFVPIDADTRKLKGGFIVKDISSLGCSMKMTSVGKIGK